MQGPIHVIVVTYIGTHDLPDMHILCPNPKG